MKEADALSEAGYNVTVLYAYWNDWGTKYDQELLPAKKWKAIRIGGHPILGRVIFNLSRVIYKAAKVLNADSAVARATFFLIREAKKHKADLYIAHNLGALPAAVLAAKHNHAYCGFDAEDFHRFETSDDVNEPEVKLKIKIEDKYLPKLDQFTASSPQIAAAYSKLYPTLKPVVLLNVFPRFNEVVTRSGLKGPLRLFWLSQTIGMGRGLEDVISAIRSVRKDDFELHLLGDLQAEFKPYIDELVMTGFPVIIHPPVHPDLVIPFASHFDIGLALENTVPLNRDICLTNKLFTYLQAGLAIIASDTKAQREFIKVHTDVGSLYSKGNISEFADHLQKFKNDEDALKTCQKVSWLLAQDTYNWEVESAKILKLVNDTLTIN